ncbi:transcription antitermination factor NusB [Saccharopolyspora griseoalba]|uniref:Transcription antitermination protein NusB n=1 Tax=Saccharopolyspora griseoalba TaxID=1431848 RepID=A0ABW2LR95_9PSEU
MAGARSKARKRAIDFLYEADQRDADPVTLLADRVGEPEVPPVHEYAVKLVEGVREHQERIDEVLSQHLEGWTLDRLPVVDRAVLRLGVYELLWCAEDVPPVVAVDEAVELARSLSTDDSPRFVNGVLGRMSNIASRLRKTIKAEEQQPVD